MTTQRVLECVQRTDGIKCIDIANVLNIKQNVVSGTLTYLKCSSVVINRCGLWYDRVVEQIQSRLLDLNDGDMNNTWNDGYLKGLEDNEIIDEHQYDKLTKWIRAAPE